MERKFFIVANPYSGQGRAQYALMRLKKKLDQEGYYYAVFLTPQSEILDEFIEENLFTDSTDVVAIGGDGTINACINAIKDKDMVLSFIPVGTGNDFVKTIDIGTDLDEHIDTLIYGKEKLVDVGICNNRRFINGLGVGFDGQIIYEDQNSTSMFNGYWRYLMRVLKILGSYKSKNYIFNMDGQKLEMNLLTMAIHNGTTFGGSFKLNPNSKNDDGLLDVCIIGRMSPVRRYLQLYKANFGSHGSLPEVNFFQTKELKIEANDQLRAHLDGEYFGHPPFEISILEKAQKVRVKI
ncbi:diacylglycerol/lipid kinase family protein [Reichenbachiella ulvae]|uniref:Diacylglycerol kinase family lipid kinase n=1 Tax=Reichenbachiella ulvae TaxID=2980104 RepID=A0ABT3CY81_9BACT|nr:diacylglycerol kinase family protein [Reichenbachiella ulvae]MCV9388582.1 diacylglycerol kinase family lipid kinase [Reichenbachiella ulvae]